MLTITTPCDGDGCEGAVTFDLSDAEPGGQRVLGRCSACGAHFTMWHGALERVTAQQIADAIVEPCLGVSDA